MFGLLFLQYKICVSLIPFILTHSRASTGHGVLWVLFVAILFRASAHVVCVCVGFFFPLCFLFLKSTPLLTAIDCCVFLVKLSDEKITSALTL